MLAGQPQQHHHDSDIIGRVSLDCELSQAIRHLLRSAALLERIARLLDSYAAGANVPAQTVRPVVTLAACSGGGQWLSVVPLDGPLPLAYQRPSDATITNSSSSVNWISVTSGVATTGSDLKSTLSAKAWSHCLSLRAFS